jgi:hypothetical protein
MRPRNFKVLSQGHRNDLLYPLKKATPGIPPGGVSFASTNWTPPQFEQTPQVGDLPSDHGIPFPATKGDVRSMTVDQIATLAYFYNDDFGIVAGHLVEDKGSYFESFLTGSLL